MKKRLFCVFLLFILTHSAYTQVSHAQGKVSTVKSTWKRRQPKRQLKEDVLLSPGTEKAMGVGNTRKEKRLKKILKAAYGEVKQNEYSPKEKAFADSLKKIHQCQKNMLLLAGKDSIRLEKNLSLLRKEAKKLQAHLHKLKDFPCRLILDNPREIVKESKRLYPSKYQSDLEHLQNIQARQKNSLKLYIENRIRAKRSLPQ
jgi:hypothetical protein